MLFRIDVQPEAVRAECARRLVALYGARDQAHVERLINDDRFAALSGDEAAAARVATAMRLADASKTIRAMTPIPADFAADDHWPTT